MGEKIIHEFGSTGTAHGQSGIRQLANGCPRRWWLYKKHGAGLVTEDPNLAKGSFLHAFMEIFYLRAMSGQSNDWQTSDVDFQLPKDSILNMYAEEAARIFRQYRARFPVETVGKVVAVEQRVPDRDASKDKKKAVSDAVGFKDYTARLDLVTHIGQDQIKDISLAREGLLGSLVTPGYYAWDWKTAMWINEVSAKRQANDLQPLYYQLAWNAMHPDMPLQGMIICTMTKTKQVKFEHTLIPTPNEGARARVLHCSKRAMDVLEAGEPFYANNDSCYSWNRECEWLTTGMCERK